MSGVQPRKHAALIKAWADGARIERKIHNVDPPLWAPDGNPTWHDSDEYRLALKVARYRRFIIIKGARIPRGASDAYVDTLVERPDVAADISDLEQDPCFVRWIDNDWQEAHQ